MAAVSAWIARLRAAMPEGLDVHYAVKANPFGPLLAGIAPLVDGLDIASAGELARGEGLMPPVRISFAGPGKRDDELAVSIRAGVTINLDPQSEATRATALGQRIGCTPRPAARLNPENPMRPPGERSG